jgi:hypothetical protein
MGVGVAESVICRSCRVELKLERMELRQRGPRTATKVLSFTEMT